MASLKSTPVIAAAAAVLAVGAIGVVSWQVAPAPPVQKPAEPARAAPESAPAPATAAAPPAAPKSEAAPAPSFDVARIEPTGEAVIAGRAAPGATVELLRDGQVHDQTVADQAGEFVLIPKPLPPGAYDLSLRATHQGVKSTSKDSVAVALAPAGKDRPIVALVSPDKPAEVLSSPPLAAPASPPAAAAPPPTSSSPPAATPPPPAAAASPPAAAPASPAPATPAAPQAVARAAPDAPAPSQPPKPAAPAELKIAIDAVESESSGKLYVAGRAQPGASVRLYLNDSYIAQATASAEGKVAFAIGSGVRPGDYQVRLDEVDSDGKVKSRAEVAFNAPVLSKPAVAEAPARPAEQTALAAATPPAAAPPPAAAAPPTPPAAAAPTTAAPATPAPTPPAAPPPQAAAPPAAAAPTPAAPPSAAPPAASAPLTSPPAAAPTAAALPPAPPPLASPPAASPPAAPPPAPVQSAAAPTPPAAPSGSAASPAAGAPAPPSVVVVPKIDTAVVERGDSLWRISRETYGRGARYSVIYRANQNQIRDPDLIYPGQIFVLPTPQ